MHRACLSQHLLPDHAGHGLLLMKRLCPNDRLAGMLEHQAGAPMAMGVALADTTAGGAWSSVSSSVPASAIAHPVLCPHQALLGTTLGRAGRFHAMRCRGNGCTRALDKSDARRCSCCFTKHAPGHLPAWHDGDSWGRARRARSSCAARQARRRRLCHAALRVPGPAAHHTARPGRSPDSEASSGVSSAVAWMRKAARVAVVNSRPSACVDDAAKFHRPSSRPPTSSVGALKLSTCCRTPRAPGGTSASCPRRQPSLSAPAPPPPLHNAFFFQKLPPLSAKTALWCAPAKLCVPTLSATALWGAWRQRAGRALSRAERGAGCGRDLPGPTPCATAVASSTEDCMSVRTAVSAAGHGGPGRPYKYLHDTRRPQCVGATRTDSCCRQSLQHHGFKEAFCLTDYQETNCRWTLLEVQEVLCGSCI